MNLVLEEAIETNPDDLDYVYGFVRTYEDLIQVNLAYLDGRMKTTPVGEEIYEETLPFLDKLREINRLGFMSYYGSPVSWDEYGKEKSLIVGILPISCYDSFVEFIQTKVGVYCEIHHIKTGRRVFTNIPCYPYNLSVHFKNEVTHPLNVHDRFNPKKDFLADYYKFPRIRKILDKCINIQLVGTNYGYGNVEDPLLEYLNKCDICIGFDRKCG